MGNGILWIIVGIISIIGGMFALANPFAATFAATQIAAYVFIFVGILQIIGGFGAEGVGAKIWNIILGALAIWLGISILGHPLAGILALTTMVGILFLVTGIIKVILAFSLEDRGPFWLILISGAISAVLAVMIFTNFPQSAAVVLGVLLGVDLISTGVSLIAMGSALRKLAQA